jgi:carbamoyltransferase
MIICGLKLTHDGAIALFDDDKLIFSIEIEKLDNNKRYHDISDLKMVTEILKKFGYELLDIDKWIIDGWDGLEDSQVELMNYGKPITLKVAPYHEGERTGKNIFDSCHKGEFHIGEHKFEYYSYLHTFGHLISSYSSSPFAEKFQPSMIMVWDGGMCPRLYYIDPETKLIESNGPFLSLIGHTYAIAGEFYFGPFATQDRKKDNYDLTVAGKLMAYIALGSERPEIVEVFDEVYNELFDTKNVIAGKEPKNKSFADYKFELNTEDIYRSIDNVHDYFSSVSKRLEGKHFKDEDILASMHVFIERLLVTNLVAQVKEWKGTGPWNLCLSGGCALNIKWNRAIRNQSIFTDVWVPPFPNDSGSAIGTAATYIFKEIGIAAIDWNFHLGPQIYDNTENDRDLMRDWQSIPCLPEQLAKMLYIENKPVVLLNDRAELGPRALGRRSIIAPAIDVEMKKILNEVKLREHYRPVAPICLRNHAPKIFDPGTPDPLMLFDHYVRPEWKDKIPAVMHLDGTARLQTVSSDNDPVLEKILRAYYKLSGIPVLCNTSANFNGSGFFPDVNSAMRWGKVDMIWSNNILYKRIKN